MKEVDHNPLTENIDQEGNQMKLDDVIKIETEYLVFDYLEVNGVRPSAYMVTNWMRRLKQAYNAGIVTKVNRE